MAGLIDKEADFFVFLGRFAELRDSLGRGLSDRFPELSPLLSQAFDEERQAAAHIAQEASRPAPPPRRVDALFPLLLHIADEFADLAFEAEQLLPRRPRRDATARATMESYRRDRCRAMLQSAGPCGGRAAHLGGTRLGRASRTGSVGT